MGAANEGTATAGGGVRTGCGCAVCGGGGTAGKKQEFGPIGHTAGTGAGKA